MRLVMLFLAFLFLGAFFVISNNNLHLADVQQASQFFGLYSNWVGSILSNSVSITGHVVNLRWLPS